MKKSSKLIVFFAAMALTIGSLVAITGNCHMQACGTQNQHGCSTMQHHECMPDRK